MLRTVRVIFISLLCVGCSAIAPVDENTNKSFFSDENFPEQDITSESEFGFEEELRPTDYLVTQSPATLGPDSNLQQKVFYFDTNSSNISAESFSALDAHAQNINSALLSNPNLVVILEGHTDERGSRSFNLSLSERRAEAVGRYLRIRGVPSSVIRKVSFGEELAAVPGNNEAAWTQNRRVEIKY